MAEKPKIAPFAIKDCALSAIATGRRAQNLRELRDGLLTVHPGSIYYHFWGGLLPPAFEDPEYNNDFASWARHRLHDVKLVEMGNKAREFVRQNFLITRHLREYLTLMVGLMHGAEDRLKLE